MLWHHLITQDVLFSCENIVENGWEVDSLLTLNGGAEDRLHIAEVISRAAARYGVTIPTTDEALAFELRFRKDTPNPRLTGGLTQTHDGRLGFNIGNGRTVESSGKSLTIITSPELTRYATGYRFQNITSL